MYIRDNHNHTKYPLSTIYVFMLKMHCFPFLTSL